MILKIIIVILLSVGLAALNVFVDSKIKHRKKGTEDD